MNEVKNNVFEQCQKSIEQAGAIELAVKEIFEKKVEFGMGVGLRLLEEGCDIQRQSKKKILGSAIRLVKNKPEKYLATVQENKVISYRTLTTEELLAKDWKVVKIPK
jgi:hypothetical protein